MMFEALCERLNFYYATLQNPFLIQVSVFLFFEAG
jgi:hypothetical protein